MRKRIILLTGNPGVGKTSVLMEVVSVLKKKRCCVGGMISREVREGGTRVGFQILDLTNGRLGWLARVNQEHGPQVGKYRVNMEDLNFIGARAVVDALVKCDVIVIDEIGPMELLSEKFKEATRKALKSDKPVLAIVHWKAKDKIIHQAKNREDQVTFTVTYQNRNKLPKTVARILFAQKSITKNYEG